jgi:hypothetical protein
VQLLAQSQAEGELMIEQMAMSAALSDVIKELRAENALLKQENEKLKAGIAAIRDEASILLSCHIETPNLAKDALRRMRAFARAVREG